MASRTVHIDVRNIRQDIVYRRFHNVNFFIGMLPPAVDSIPQFHGGDEEAAARRQPTLYIVKCTNVNFISCSGSGGGNLSAGSDPSTRSLGLPIVVIRACRNVRIHGSEGSSVADPPGLFLLLLLTPLYSIYPILAGKRRSREKG